MKGLRIVLVSFIALFFGQVQASNLPNFAPLIEKYSPAVVNISTVQKPKKSRLGNKKFDLRQFEDKLPLEEMPEFFKRFFDQGFSQQNFQLQKSPKMSSLGSGMIISQDGYILTNHHVINGASEIIVRLKSRQEYKAKVIGSDKDTDVALIKIEAENLPTITIGNSDALKVGEWVFAIGSPFGFDLSASAGIVSAKGRSVPGESEYNYVPFIQTDVAINPGNSGGPLFNLAGEVVGINSMIYSRSGGYMGVSFSIPIDVAMRVVKQIRETGKVTRGWLGVMIQPVTFDLSKSFGMDKPEGSLVAEIMKDSPADRSDLQVGDVILKFNGKEILKNSDLPPIVASISVGTTAPIDILRKGKRMVISVKIDAMPTHEAVAINEANSKSKIQSAAGMSLVAVPDTMREKLNIKSGGVLVSSVETDSPAEKSGLITGDVILKLNYNDVADVAKLQELLKALPKEQSVPLLVKRGKASTFLAFKK